MDAAAGADRFTMDARGDTHADTAADTAGNPDAVVDGLPDAPSDRSSDAIAPTDASSPDAPPADASDASANLDGGSDACTMTSDMPMIAVPGGSFMMGSTRSADTQPIHAVTLLRFEIDATEVTTAAYTKCVDAGGCTPPPAGTEGGICNFTVCSRQSHPINCVSWDQADAYCAWVGKRLPTEEEWEYAARSSDNRTYPWGEQYPSASLYNGSGTGDGWVFSAPVASFPAGRSPFGAYDMAGNVDEWTSSLYCPYDGTACTSADGVLRGGDFTSGNGFGVSAEVRSPAPAQGSGFWASGFGFRCAR